VSLLRPASHGGRGAYDGDRLGWRSRGGSTLSHRTDSRRSKPRDSCSRGADGCGYRKDGARKRPLIVTDAAINIYPSLDDKVDIVKNAIDLAHTIGLEHPNVAILSAIETVTSKIVSTIDAAALCKMADRGQITGALLDGPLAFDTAVSASAAATKNLRSPVAGAADVLVVPDLEAGNILVKELEYIGGTELAGVVLGATVPIVLTSRADSIQARVASCALALLCVRTRPDSRDLAQ
jgi:phosphotransacetylase